MQTPNNPPGQNSAPGQTPASPQGAPARHTVSPAATTTVTISGTTTEPVTIHRIVFTASALMTITLIAFTLLFPSVSERVLGHALAWVSDRFGWYYMLIVAAYGIFSLYVGISKYGDIKLGQTTKNPTSPTWPGPPCCSRPASVSTCYSSACRNR